MSDTERRVSASFLGRHAASLAGETARALRFFSRLPVPVLRWETEPHAAPSFARLPRVLPLAGVIVAAPAAVLLALADRWGVPDMAAAALAVAAQLVATGGMHEDGLADTADGFGGGHTAERRLAIMADSRIGAFGAMALVLALLLRVILLGTLLADDGAWPAAGALLAAAAASRTAMAVPLWLLPSARPGGRSSSVGRATGGAMLASAALSLVLALLLAAHSASAGRIVLALALAGALALLMTAWSRRMLGGQTGDVAGATQVLAEITILLALASG